MLFTIPSVVAGIWFIVFIASIIIIVWPFFILSPIWINCFAPGSAARYAVPIIGDLTPIPSSSFDSALFNVIVSESLPAAEIFVPLETLILVSPLWYSYSVNLNSSKLSTSSLINFLSIFIFDYFF